MTANAETRQPVAKLMTKLDAYLITLGQISIRTQAVPSSTVDTTGHLNRPDA
jgi:hypothetical protein